MAIEKSIADEVPTNWLDPLLTGPGAVIGKPPYNCKDVERLLLAIKERIAARARLTTEQGAPQDAAWACVWEEDDEGVWRTSCGNAWQFTDGGPSDNGQEYCGYCGKPLSELQLATSVVETDDEER